MLLKETYLLLNGHLAGFLCNAFPGQKHASGWKSLFLSSYHPTLTIPRPGEWLTERFGFLREALNENWDWSPWVLLLLCFFYWPLSSVSVGHGSVVSVSPDNLLEMQNLRFHTRLVESEYSFRTSVNIKILKALLFMDYTSICRQSHACIIPF